MTEADLSDVVEQGRAVVDDGADPTPATIEDTEAPDADAIEQSQSVPIDEDDYR
jgi:hypothetical protein